MFSSYKQTLFLSQKIKTATVTKVGCAVSSVGGRRRRPRLENGAVDLAELNHATLYGDDRRVVVAAAQRPRRLTAPAGRGEEVQDGRAGRVFAHVVTRVSASRVRRPQRVDDRAEQHQQERGKVEPVELETSQTLDPILPI